MKLSVIIKSALESLRNNRRRTFLTMIGIIIGIASVITILSLGNGFRDSTVNSLTKDSSGRQSVDFNFELSGSEEPYATFQPFSDQDIALISDVEGVDEVTESQNELPKQEYYEIAARDFRESLAVDIQLKAYDRQLLAGRLLTPKEQRSIEALAVIDDRVATSAYGSTENALGKGVEINSKVFIIIGVVQSEETNNLNFALSGSPDQMEVPPGNIIIANGAYNKFFKPNIPRYSVTVYLKAGADPKEVPKEIKQVLNKSGSSIKHGQYIFFDMGDIMKEIGRVLNMLTYFISSVAGISLFIAGVGVMNMMYISVSERIKEIGIRRSMGATKQSILIQFLLEGVMITLLGGLIGFFLGVLIAFAISQLLPFSIELDFFMIAMTIFVSAFIGVVFSVFPAKMAANKNLIDILR